MNEIMSVLTYFVDLRFVLLVFAGSVAGLFVGAIPGLSVSMATALLVSVTYTWSTADALATVMGVYIVGVFSGAISAILINIPGAPSSVVTTLDGFPLANKGESYKALKFTPMDYFLLAPFGLATVGSLTAKSFSKGLISAMLGLVVSMIGLDSVMGTPRMTFGIYDLQAGINTVPALVGLFGFAEVLSVIADGNLEAEVSQITKKVVKMKEVSRHWLSSMYYSAIGTAVGALPGAGGPVAAFLAYGEAKRIVKNPSVPFGEGAVEGIVASESANNACIGGALIPMLTLAVPGDAVTAIILSVFYVHGLRPGPMFIKTSPDMFAAILAGGFIGCIFLMILGLLVAPKLSKVIAIPKKILLPIVTVLCVIGAFACNNRLFDVALMFVFGILGYFMRHRGYSVAPMTLAIVLGGMMDSNFRRAISLASSEDNMMAALFGRPITMILLVLTVLTICANIPAVKRLFAKKRASRKTVK